MYTFFQESLRKTIKHDIYKETTVAITLRDTSYRAIKKEKKV
jgi:hypothetical protein